MKVIFVHGCFWHGHECKKEKMPKSNVIFWDEKISGNRARDAKVQEELATLGWSSLIVWECESKSPDVLKAKLIDFLGPSSRAET
jgi:DNA mismatch endonuclease, patch repair protein